MRMREEKILKMQMSYGYDRDNALKIIEAREVRSVQTLFGCGVGAFAIMKSRPIRAEIARSYPIFRKPWMRVTLPAAIFLTAYHISTALPQRLGRKISWTPVVSHDVYTSDEDLVGRFRLFQTSATCDNEQELTSYLAAYSTEALTEPEIIASLEKERSR